MCSPTVCPVCHVCRSVLAGVHLTCYRQFDGYGGEIAHKFYRDVHFDNSEPYTAEVTDGSRLSLLLVSGGCLVST